MISLKKAFTLSELLLCIGIIGIVSAMGMTIAKQGTDRAYNLFYYSGYINLYNAIADAKAAGAGTSNVQIMAHVRELLDTDNNAANIEANNVATIAGWLAPGSANATEITTVNGIRYYYPNNITDGYNGIPNLNVNVATNAVPITMVIPQRKTRANNGYAVVYLAYVDTDNGYLIPMAAAGTVNLQTRRDLLPAYVDDGVIGRNNVINRNNFDYQPIAYYSYRDAFCTIRNNSGIGNLISCNNAATAWPREGILKIADPRRAR